MPCNTCSQQGFSQRSGVGVVHMGSRRWHKIAWCALFVCSMGGPYLLSVRGDVGSYASTGAYAFAALGMLTGIWASRYPAVVRLFLRTAVWKTCLGVGLLMSAVLLALDVSEVVVLEAAASGRLVQLLNVVANGLGSFEGAYAFFLSLLCCVSSFCLRHAEGAVAPPSRNPQAWILWASFAAFLAGVLRTRAWAVLSVLPFGLPFLLLTLFCWAACASRRSCIWACIAAASLGELASRLLSRFGVVLPPDGVVDAGALVASLLLLGVSIVIPCLFQGEHIQGDGLADGGFPLNRAEDSRRTRLLQLGLTERESDVLLLSAEGRNASQVAERLGMRASTVRTYKARVCKKLHLDTFDRVLAECLAAQDSCNRKGVESQSESCHVDVCSDATRLAAFVASAHFSGLLSFFLLVLMPFGALPASWNSVWVMGYGLAAGGTACIAFLIAVPSGCRIDSRLRGAVISVGTFVCALICLSVRAAIEHGVTGFGFSQRIGVFVSVGGFACLAFLRLRQLIGSPRLDKRCLAVACAVASGLVAGAAVFPSLWLAFTVVSLLLYAVGMRQACDVRADRGTFLETDPVVGISWFVLAFVWEECWRGVGYSSMQDIGIPFLLILVVLDVIALRKNDEIERGTCVVLGAFVACIAAVRGLAFALLVLAAILEVASCCMRAGWNRTCGDSDGSRLPAALLGIPVGCCAAVYISNGRGTYVLLHAIEILPDGLDWCALCCCAAFLVAALCRAVFVPLCEPPSVVEIAQNRLRGYLVAHGLALAEVEVCLHLARGESVMQIADVLSYSVSAVHMLKRHAFAKLGVTTRQQYTALLWREFSQA